MAVFNPMTLTGAGENLLAQAVAGEGALSFTAVSTSGTVFSGDPKTATELQDIMQTVVPSVAVLSGDTIQVSSIFSNDSITQEYVARTVGMYAKINNESPALFAIAVATDPDTIPAQNPISPSTFYYQFNISVSDASNVTVSVPEDGSLPASVFYQKLGNTDISQVADGTLTGAINQNTNVIGGDAYDSSKSYAAGDYFIYNNQLCKALTAISAGTSLSEGTNYETTSLENEIAGLNGNIGGLRFLELWASPTESINLSEAFQKFYQNGDISSRACFVAHISFGTQYSAIGYFYGEYGSAIVVGLSGAVGVYLNNGVWSQKSL